MLRDDRDDVAEAFARFCEDLWRGLGRFRGDSSYRTWVYALARRAALQLLRGARRRGRRFVLAGAPDQLNDIAVAVRTQTLPQLRSDAKRRLVRARDCLAPDDRTLLILRVDRQLGWRDIARVLAEGDLDAGALRRREQALRKRFETVKRRLAEQMNRVPAAPAIATGVAAGRRTS